MTPEGFPPPPDFRNIPTESATGRYKYASFHTWELKKDLFIGKPKHGGILCVIGLHPAHIQECPTVRRCKSLGQSLGFRELIMVNLFAMKANTPDEILSNTKPIGSENDNWLIKSAETADMIVCAWGEHGGHLRRNTEALEAIHHFTRKLHCLRTNKNNIPSHPLEIKSNPNPQRYHP